jgi:exoribonuclease II
MSTDSEGYKSIAYGKLTAVKIEAIKEWQPQNEIMVQQIRALSASAD